MVVKSSHEDLVIPDESLASLLLRAMSEHGDKVAMVDIPAQQTITFREIHERTRRCANALIKLGLQHGDIVGICAPSCTEFSVVTLAVVACGAIVTTVNPAYKEGEVIQQFSISGPRMVFASNEALDTVQKVVKTINSIEKIFVIGESTTYTTLQALIDSGEEKDILRKIDAKNDAAILLYSSGTTGMPKSVMHTHHSLSAMILTYSCRYNTRPASCLYMDRPMFHIGGLGPALTGLYRGYKVVLEREFHPERMLKAIEVYKVTHSSTVPPVMISLLQTPNWSQFDTSSLEEIGCGGAMVAPQLITGLKERFGVPVLQGYGMTECGVLAHQAGTAAPLNSVGKVVHNTTVKIADLNTGEDLKPHENGEILVKGPQVMKGYFKNPEATEQAIDKDGWLHTGDIGYFDEDDFLYVIDRLKEVIKYKALQVSPAEIEAVLLKHPKIADVGVVGIPDSYAGEIPLAFVVKSDESLTKAEVTTMVEEELTEYKHLRGGVHFTGVIPKTITGKIQRTELKKMAAEIL